MSGGKGRPSVAVRIAGHEYKIRSDGDEAGLVQIAGYVDRAMQRVREKTGTIDSLDVAVLTCLNLAREILAIHDQRASGVDAEKIRQLIEMVESVVSGRVEGEQTDGTVASHESHPTVAESRSRTLELPSVEDLRERMPSKTTANSAANIAANNAANSASESADPHLAVAPARAAAGGRDRVG